MLVLTRRINEKIVFPSIATRLQIVAIKAGVVRVGIDAPPSVPIYREELLDRAGFVESLPAAQQPNSEARLHMLRQNLRDGIARALTDLDTLRQQLDAGIELDRTALDRLAHDLRRLEKLIGI